MLEEDNEEESEIYLQIKLNTVITEYEEHKFIQVKDVSSKIQ